jgi:hypothetical protein
MMVVQQGDAIFRPQTKFWLTGAEAGSVGKEVYVRLNIQRSTDRGLHRDAWLRGQG